MEDKDITIIIPTHAKLEFLKACIVRIREVSQDVNILVGADTASEDVKHWLQTNETSLNFKVIFCDATPETAHPLEFRLGIIEMVEKLVDLVETDYVCYIHDDMIIGDYMLQNFMNNWKPNHIVSGFRIEPPIYGPGGDKVEMNLGYSPDEFKLQEFLDAETKLIETQGEKQVRGFFAPHFFAKEDFVGYDHLFLPFNREDSDIAFRFEDAGKTLEMCFDCIVYHFSGKGNRNRQEKKYNDAFKWHHIKNSKNFVRKYKSLAHNEYNTPIRVPNISISAHVLVSQSDVDYIPDLLNNIEPYFEEIVFVCDGSSTELKPHLNAYKQEIDKYQPHNFSYSKFKVYERDLENDFATQTNYAIEQCSNEWVMKIDADEHIDERTLDVFRIYLGHFIKENSNIKVVGFPRLNYLDGKISNDIPREHWYNDMFNQYPDRVDNVQNPDLQFRLHRKDVKWVGTVHEVPEPVVNNEVENIKIIPDAFIHHPKSRERQAKQDKFYKNMNGPVEINKFVFDSVIYTREGITEHARQEALELHRRGKEVLLLDQNYRDGFDNELKQLYVPFDLTKPNYITIVNQPPTRWDNSKHLQNRIGYLAFEGILPQKWVQLINASNIVELWTPSNYCKEMFEKSGVQKPIAVIPHGVNGEIFKPKSLDKMPKFTFLGMGTTQNSRKGLDLLAKAFNEEFANEDDVQLLLKVNKIYNPNDNINDYFSEHISPEGNTNIFITDDVISDEEMAELFHRSHVYVSPHRSEGFGMNILNAMACGLPVVSTSQTGERDYLAGKESVLEVNTEGLRWAPYIAPYDRAKWYEPSLESLKKQMRYSYENHKDLEFKAYPVSVEIREDYSWDKIVDKMEERLKELT